MFYEILPIYRRMGPYRRNGVDSSKQASKQAASSHFRRTTYFATWVCLCALPRASVWKNPLQVHDVSPRVVRMHTMVCRGRPPQPMLCT